MKLSERERELLRLVEAYRDDECRRIIDQARAQATELVRQTYRKERAHLHQLVVDERGRARARIQVARAERETRERNQGDLANARLLIRAWPNLRDALLQRWSVAETRGQWVSHYLGYAVEVLPKGRWVIRHAPEWSETERSGSAEKLQRAVGHRPAFHADGEIEAGLITECAGAVLDASLDGLLADRSRLEARLLALFHQERGR